MEKELKKLQSDLCCESSSIWLIDEDDDQVLYPYIFLGDKSETLMDKDISINQGVCGYVTRTRQEVLTNNPMNDPNYNQFFNKNSGFVTKNLICLPLVLNDECIGCLQLLNKSSDFNKEDIIKTKEFISNVLQEL